MKAKPPSQKEIQRVDGEPTQILEEISLEVLRVIHSCAPGEMQTALLKSITYINRVCRHTTLKVMNIQIWNLRLSVVLFIIHFK